jgi:hypothetical protein
MDNHPTHLSGRALFRSYLPLFAAVAAIALLVAMLPSTRPQVNATLGNDSSSLDNGEQTATEDSSLPGVTDGSAVSGDSPAANGTRKPTATNTAALQRPADCPRKRLGFDNCPYEWAGTNTGSTYSGVTGDTINLTIYDPKADDQTSGALGADGSAPTPAEIQKVADAWATFVNNNFQLYGRKVRIRYRQGPGGYLDPAQANADAVTIANEDKPFAVLAPAATQPLHDELSRRKIISITALLQFTASYHAERAPYVYGLLPDLDLALDHVAEYWCSRLEGKPAAHAGTGIEGKPRKFGVIYNSDYNQGGPKLLSKIQRLCNGTVAKVVATYGDYSTAVSQSTNIIGQMRNAGVTTVSCICDPVSPLFLTAQATAQGYFPEWLQTAYFAQDADSVGRLYDQEQWKHSFGPGVIGPATPKKQDKSYIAFTNGSPSVPESKWKGVSYYWSLLETIVYGIEQAGPNLNPVTLRDGLFKPDTFPPANGPLQPKQSFGPSGPSPWTQTDEELEVWWDPNRTAADGEKGAYFLVRGGQRYSVGAWPKTIPNVFVDDGSPQPVPGSAK